MKKFIDRTRERHRISDGQIIEIIEYFNSYNATIKFLKSGNIRKNIMYHNIKNGSVRDFYFPTFEGIGYLGEGKYKMKTHKIFFNKWQSMITRCYSESYHKTRPTYISCSVVKEWFNFQVFAEWCENNYVDSFVLDKDILIKGNKIYGPETCCFVPEEINALFIKNNINRGEFPIEVTKNNNLFSSSISIDKKIYQKLFKSVGEAFENYVFIKEKYICELAEKWKNKIPEKVYQILINYKVEITD